MQKSHPSRETTHNGAQPALHPTASPHSPEEAYQLTFPETSPLKKFSLIFNNIRNGKFQTAHQQCEEVHTQSVTNKIETPEIFPIMKCLMFWLNTRRIASIHDFPPGALRAEKLTNEYRLFEEFLKKFNFETLGSDFLIYFKLAVYDEIINNYIDQFNEADIKDATLLLNLSQALLINNYYTRARDTLLYARKFRTEDAYLNALLGEAFYHCGNEDKAVACFKEAFYFNPCEVVLGEIKTPFIKNLATALEEKGFIGKEINLWLPIYAILNDIFYVKKKLSEAEQARANKQIREMEILFEVNKKKRAEIEPRLIFHYIYLLDHYLASEIYPETIAFKDLLRKIRPVNESVYHKLRKYYGIK